ncbi:hypothetical protein Tco_1130556 [Tanacetum coccineum]
MKTITDQGNPTSNPRVPPFERDQVEADLTGDDKKRFKADIDAMNAILLGIPNDIYNSIDACKTAQAMWQRVQRLIQGTDLSKHELTLRLLHEFDKFKGMPAESTKECYFGQQANGNNTIVQRTPRTSATSRNTQNVQFYNFNKKGHYARVCSKLRVRDSNYFKEQMLLAKKDEA